MSKEVLKKLNVYAESLKSRLQSPVTAKHAGHPAQFKQFLERELAAVNAKIEGIKMGALK